ncbi:putative protein [alpha proteobacterium Q-1]|nr:putative protein [alpha proteobacterium Q-1]
MPKIDAESPTDDQAQQDLKSAKSLMKAGQIATALQELDDLLAKSPDHPDGLYMAAVCLRYLGRSDEAAHKLVRLKEVAPDFARAFQEEGHLLRAVQRPEEALKAYERACRLNPALIASWKAQADLFEQLGRLGPARQARGQAEKLMALPKELLDASLLLHEGKPLKAEALCRAFLQAHPHHIDAMRLLAAIGVRMGVLEDADFLLESALVFAPDQIDIRLDYIEVLRKRQKYEAARDQARLLYEKDPNNPVFLSHYAIESLQLGDYDLALDLFDRVLAILPDDPATLTSRGHALKTRGDREAAITSYRAAFAARPDHAEAYYALANLKTYRFSDEDRAQMKAQEQSAWIGPQERIYFCFALGKAYEDRGDYETAFRFYARGNDLKSRQISYRSDQMEAELKAQADICTPQLMQKQADQGHMAPDPIFILGLPRAGSTLVEQILASHSEVDGTLELPNILALAHRLRGRTSGRAASRYPAILQELSAEKLEDLGRDYIENTRIHRQNAPFFTDKMPNNFRHIGLIHLILPRAKIIDARRHPMACCFSGYKQLFAEGQEFTYRLEDMGRYYRAYVEMMDHWDRVLPGRIFRVHHEKLVADTENTVRALLDFCGLPFEDACLQFHKNKRSVRTASSEQVRQPISAKGLAQWRHFEPWLDPLKQALGPALTSYPDF